MNVHFIAIGGSAMHNLAIALSRKNYNVTGSDDEIFEPSASRLKQQGIFPKQIGWDSNNVNEKLDAIIVGMHARADNPELIKARSIGVPVFSYPEYLYEQSKDKIRVVIGGSHGKTSITAMILHAISVVGLDVDYMVGAQLEGYDCMVKLSESAKIMILEGDEYLSSPIDRRPKFHLYHPSIALISGIAWDHINVFPTFENYVSQFDIFCQKIERQGVLIYNQEDEIVNQLGIKYSHKLNSIAYSTPNYSTNENGTEIELDGKKYVFQIFGAHNMQNLMGAKEICKQIGVSNQEFLSALQSFKGAGKRLQKVVEKKGFVMFKDFAHSPSKLKATTSAVKEQFKEKLVVACMELHTFSSLNKEYLPLYNGAMKHADRAIVYFNTNVVTHKRLPAISVEEVKNAFGGEVEVYNSTEQVLQIVQNINVNDSILLMMSSGDFDGIDYELLGQDLIAKFE
jgi:UDP-N-acetylmuramate: L-alanyl-gamma-D-glutamyl-meso-diaminopimelate ligase